MSETIPGYAQAARDHDLKPPPEPEPCRYCDDLGILEIAALYDVNGLPREVPGTYHHEVPCPWCPLR